MSALDGKRTLTGSESKNPSGPGEIKRRFYPPTESDLYHGTVASGRVYTDVHRERIRAHKKHDANGQSMERKPHDHGIWLPVLTEEVGEVARVLCEAEDGVIDRAKLREELVQAAAMTVAWIDAIDLEIVDE